MRKEAPGQINAPVISKQKPKKKQLVPFLIEVFAVLICAIVFLIPFYFIIINSFKTSKEAAEMSMSLPSTYQILANFTEVLTTRDNMLLLAYYNSTVITVFSVAVLVIVCSMTGFILQRRSGKGKTVLGFAVLSGLMVPPAIVPTIWVLDLLGLFKTMPGIISIMVALGIPFSIILYSGFIATIPKEIDEAAVLDGCGSWRLFFKIIFPLLKPIHSTVIIISSVNIFNDFVHPLYFFPGAQNATVQLTLYNFMSMYNTSWNLLFANVLLITIPPFILFMFFSKKIVAGMTSGSVKA
ncbi:raffinose/stachyose/melibiose transport system permease protein [Evansella caseinilytica]|uniref:Raffinose/stachyose/melibiose transport system permease protein n=1 Tax=Evansella caseinilytica TaxID=1503961 RepID=A0A1H3IRN7_9BACI|nr:carbohydrate ABC transporter permease [Evansella caseinilytica]SDY30362.1 raffinose/stachyose/melibiose transport system permease protein [Evansella caseinilytica]